MIFPDTLKRGDQIGMLCASGYMPLEKTQQCVETLELWGFKVKLMPTVGHQFHYFSGTDEERLHDLQTLLDDKDIKAILFGRGGYGLSRIIDRMDFKKFKRSPKWIIGYSDITLLHSHINRNLKIATIHSPMAAAFQDGVDDYLLSLKKILLGRKNTYTSVNSDYNKAGTVAAELVGGNLCMLAHALGTNSCYATKNKIIFIEDVGEYLYNVDRMLWQLKRAHFFDDIAGLVVGGFTDMKDTTIPFGKTIDELIFEHFVDTKFPIAFNFPVGHQRENYALKVGGTYQFEVKKNKAVIKEL